MSAPIFQFKRGLLSNLPGLQAGEPGFTTDSYDFYIGLTSESATNRFFGSHRYWDREDGTNSLGLNLVDKDGSNYIQIKTPNTLAGIVTYTLPPTPIDGYLLQTDGDGTLSWSQSVTGFTAGIATFTNTTDNTLGDSNTGSVQMHGGVGIDKNLTVGGNLNVQGYSEFVGVVTFRGGTINLGDGNTDDINVAGEFISNLVPNTDATYDIGDGGSTKSWRNASFSGIGTFASGAVIDAIQIGISGTNEIDTTSGNLTLDSAAGTVIVDDSFSVSGVSTFTGAIDANGDLDVDGRTELDVTNISDTLNVAGVSTFASAVDINGDLDVDGRTELDVTNISDTLNVAGVSTFASAVDINSSVDISDNLTVTGISTFTGSIDANGGADISGGETTLSSATVSDLTAGRVVLAGTSGELEDSGSLTFSGGGGLTVGAGGINVTGISTFSTDLVVGGDVRINGNDIKSSDGNTNITLTSNTLTTFSGDIKVTGNDIQSSTATSITLSGSDVTVAGDLQVTGNDIKSSTGAVAITLAANDVTIADDLTVNGNLYVNGSTTQVNTAALTVEDRTIDLGIVDGSSPASDTTWDLGVLFNYYTSGAAKKSAVIWEHADSRFKFASVIGSDTNGTDANTPQLTVTTFAPIEVGALWVNDCAGQSQVITCSGTTRKLENIVIDAGTF